MKKLFITALLAFLIPSMLLGTEDVQGTDASQEHVKNIVSVTEEQVLGDDFYDKIKKRKDFKAWRSKMLNKYAGIIENVVESVHKLTFPREIAVLIADLTTDYVEYGDELFRKISKRKITNASQKYSFMFIPLHELSIDIDTDEEPVPRNEVTTDLNFDDCFIYMHNEIFRGRLKSCGHYLEISGSSWDNCTIYLEELSSLIFENFKIKGSKFSNLAYILNIRFEDSEIKNSEFTDLSHVKDFWFKSNVKLKGCTLRNLTIKGNFNFLEDIDIEDCNFINLSGTNFCFIKNIKVKNSKLIGFNYRPKGLCFGESVKFENCTMDHDLIIRAITNNAYVDEKTLSNSNFSSSLVAMGIIDYLINRLGS